MQPSAKPSRARNYVKWSGIAILILAITGSVLTLALAGSVKPQTVQIVDASNHATPLYGELLSGTSIGYNDNFSGWQMGQSNPSVETQLSQGHGKLTINGTINNAPTPIDVAIFKDAKIDIATYSILEVEVNVTSGVSYGLRFFGQYPNGTQFNVWWEDSSLDHRTGQGFEIIRLNMLRQAFLATGRQVNSLTRLEMYVESRPNNPSQFTIQLLELRFSSETFGPIAENGDYRAVYVDLGTSIQGNTTWSLNRIQLDVTIGAKPNTVFALYLLDGSTLFTTVETPSSYQYSQLTPEYNIVIYPVESQGLFPELLPKSNASIVLVTSTGSVQSASLNSLDLIYIPSVESTVNVSQSYSALYYVYFIFFLFLLPLGIALIVYQEFIHRQSSSRRAIASVFVAGLICRFALVPLAQHPFDMNILIVSARGWFQYGSTRLSPGPTLPVTFFLYWVPYSFFALIQNLGFKDVFLPFHDAGIVETIFIKLFPISADAVIFTVLLRFKTGGRGLVWASFYFLNPLTIFVTSVLGHYDAATLALVVVGIYWMSTERVLRAGLAFVASGFLEIVGIIPFIFLIANTLRTKHYKMSVALSAIGLTTLAYPPQRDSLYSLLLGISGFARNVQFSSGRYTLLGSFGLTGIVSYFHLLLIVGILLLIPVSLDLIRKELHVKSLLLYTCLAFVAFLLLLNLPSEWFWLLPVGLLYSIIAAKESLGAFMLVFGTAACFFLVNLVGSAYFLLGSSLQPILPQIESVRNSLQIFTIMMTILAALFLVYIKIVRSNPTETLIRSALLVIGSFILVYFWIGVYPI